MPRSQYHGHRFPPEIIRQAVWLYIRFTLSFRDVEDLLAERGLDVSYETIRRVLKFGPIFARELRRRREGSVTMMGCRRATSVCFRAQIAAVAASHCSCASARNSRSVGREIRCR